MCQPGPFACTLRSVGRTLQTRPGGGAMGVVGRGSLRQPRAVGPVTQRCRGDWLQGGAAWRELPLVARTGLGFPLSPHPLFRSRSLARVVWFCCWSEMVWFKDVQGCSRRKDGRGRGGWGSPPRACAPGSGAPTPCSAAGAASSFQIPRPQTGCRPGRRRHLLPSPEYLQSLSTSRSPSRPPPWPRSLPPTLSLPCVRPGACFEAAALPRIWRRAPFTGPHPGAGFGPAGL